MDPERARRQLSKAKLLRELADHTLAGTGLDNEINVELADQLDRWADRLGPRTLVRDWTEPTLFDTEET